MPSFKDLSLSPDLLRITESMGYEQPSPIQAQALPILLGEPTDFVGLAATGTGKTAAFALPLLEKLNAKKRGVQALVLCPTRELAVQVADQISLMGIRAGVEALPIYGGASITQQVRKLEQGTSIVVGTPGRLIDHLKRGTLSLKGVRTLVLDEADEMISMGFKEDLEEIMAAADRDKCQFWLFSATMGAAVRSIAEQYLRNPQRVQVNKTEMLSQTVQQIYYPAKEGDKPEILCKLMDVAEGFYGVVFCQTKSMVADLTQHLIERGYKADSLHGDKDQNARERTLDSFKAKKVNILVCTDVAARGLDVKDITHVINYSLPRELDSYVHRIGRTARSGKSGVAISLVTPSHRRLLEKIERLTKSRMERGRIPTRYDVARKKVSGLLENFTNTKGYDKAKDLLDESWQAELSSMSSQEVAARFIALMYNEIFDERKTKKVRASIGQPTRQPRSAAKPGPRRAKDEDRPARSGPKKNFRRSEKRRSEVRGSEEGPDKQKRARPKVKTRSSNEAFGGTEKPKRRLTNKERFPKPTGPNRKERRLAKFGPPPSESWDKA